MRRMAAYDPERHGFSMLRLISAAAANAETELTLGEKLSEGVMTMIIGVGTTFVVLIVLWMLVALMGRIVSSMSGKKAAAIPAPAETKPEPVQEAAAEPEETVTPELIAVLSAAIAAYEGPDAPRMTIRSVRRTTQWNGGRR